MNTKAFRAIMADPLVIKLKKTHPDAIVPDYQSAGAACFDLHSIESTTVASWREPKILRTGLSVEIPPGWVMLIFSRSGHGFKNDVRLANAVGVIDADYRGEIMVKLHRDSPGLREDRSTLSVSKGDRIAQAMIIPRPTVKFEVVNELGDTARGAGGFGSTDRYADNPGDDPFGSEGKHGWRLKDPAHPGNL
ncbi:Deoxyuridine 5'-triphosphate nucleotidohydrolase [compost metagenome]